MQFVKGDVVVVPFPFSASSGDKLRPAQRVSVYCRHTNAPFERRLRHELDY